MDTKQIASFAQEYLFATQGRPVVQKSCAKCFRPEQTKFLPIKLQNIFFK
jgi:hypothetical protein